MKKKNSVMLIGYVVFFMLFSILQMNLSTKTRIRPTHSITIRALKGMELKTNISLEKEFRKKNKVDLDLSIPDHSPPPPVAQITCDQSHYNYDTCSINGPTVLDPNSSTFFLMGQTNLAHQSVQKIRPYPRKSENQTMSGIKELTLISGPLGPLCQIQHKAPALVFSAGGYTGNFFHEFNDGFLPLFITVNTFFSDQEFVLVISKSRDWWVNKYSELLHSFTKHPSINLDSDSSTHCFPAAKIGLISHGFMTINPELTPNSVNFSHFQTFLSKTYGDSYTPSVRQNARPKLVLVTRSGIIGRVILNQKEVRKMAEEIGFDVIEFEPTVKTPLKEAYRLIASSDAMVGVHGAALTHSLFLRRGAVLMQVVPIGTEWVSTVCFGRAAKDLGLEYLEYKIGVEESSLVEKYGKDHMLVKDPIGILKKGWDKEVMDIYLKKQNVKLDLIKFRGYLEEAYEKANKFMDNNNVIVKNVGQAKI